MAKTLAMHLADLHNLSKHHKVRTSWYEVLGWSLAIPIKAVDGTAKAE